MVWVFVWRAPHLRLEPVVALKIVQSSRLASPEEVERFETEARIIAALEHTHIVPVHEIGEPGVSDFGLESIILKCLEKAPDLDSNRPSLKTSGVPDRIV